ncbi:RING finger protein 32 [Protopterus annectens]|uniref:RING finger protein 32 n=1 Tax=Protopterus annectens TaxID=7888 RepID=UPI001CFAA26E|nr:RING finger protein 32 [Protopterus annectens]XP_043920722.1 RING finger protein 32 [Protopterus annectens]
MSAKTGTNKSHTSKPEGLALAAAALQDHILHSLHLQNMSLSNPLKTKLCMKYKGCKPSTTHSVQAVVDSGLRRRKTTYCNLKGAADDQDKEYVLDPSPSPLSLAQKLGLVETPVAPLSTEEWAKVKKRSVEQGDSSQPCVICKEEFGLQQQVLLSCSHVFHRVCLQSFERFSGRKTCPLCRKEQYQTRVIHDGTNKYKNKCAAKIQALWRGYIVRKWYRHLRKTVPPKDKTLRKRFYEEKFQEISNRLLKSCETNVEEFISEIDQCLTANSNMLQKLDNLCSPTISDEEWQKIQLKAIQRETMDCPICITPLSHSSSFPGSSVPDSGDQYHSSRQMVLLSCSHLFHHTCLQAFEDLTIERKLICPLCRSFYQKRVL